MNVTTRGEQSNPARDFHSFGEDGAASGLRTYQELVVGDRCPWHLARYEVLTVCLTFLPGLAGLALRRVLYRGLFRAMGAKAVIGVGVTLRQPGRIALGKGCVIEDYARLSVRGGPDDGIELADRVLVGRGAAINVRDGRVVVGPHTTLGAGSRIGCTQGRVAIGSYVMVAGDCYIGGAGHRAERLDVPMALQGTATKGGVTIGDDVWIGAQSVVLDGATIGRGSIIGACSLVNGDIPEYSVAYGQPARVQRRREGGGQTA